MNFLLSAIIEDGLSVRTVANEVTVETMSISICTYYAIIK